MANRWRFFRKTVFGGIILLILLLRGLPRFPLLRPLMPVVASFSPLLRPWLPVVAFVDAWGGVFLPVVAPFRLTPG